MAGPRLTDDRIEKAVRLLDAWSGKLSWDRFLAVLETELGHRYTKMAMHKHPRIISAWQQAKARVSVGPDNKHRIRHGDAALAVAHRKIEELKARNQRLEQENRDLLEQFLRWSHNAARAGLTPEQLDAPLPRISGTEP